MDMVIFFILIAIIVGVFIYMGELCEKINTFNWLIIDKDSTINRLKEKIIDKDRDINRLATKCDRLIQKRRVGRVPKK
jgi:hypothetical protein